jgi:hypothetical protein
MTPPRRPLLVFRRDGALVAWLPTSVPDDIDLAVIDRLARLALEARRAGARLEVVGLDGAALELVELAGLGAVLRPAAERSVEVLGQADVGEQRGVQEVVEADDAAARHLDEL